MEFTGVVSDLATIWFYLLSIHMRLISPLFGVGLVKLVF